MRLAASMRAVIFLLSGVLLIASGPVAIAAEQTVRLEAVGDCPGCDYVMTAILERTEGVSLVELKPISVDETVFEIRVSFDNSVCSPEILVAALESYGFFPKVLR